MKRRDLLRGGSLVLCLGATDLVFGASIVGAEALGDLTARQRARKGTPIGGATVARVRATLRAALNAAVREGLITTNPLAQVRLEKPVRPHPVIRTDRLDLRLGLWP